MQKPLANPGVKRLNDPDGNNRACVRKCGNTSVFLPILAAKKKRSAIDLTIIGYGIGCNRSWNCRLMQVNWQRR